MRFEKHNVLEVAHKLEQIKNRIQLYIEELKCVKDKLTYSDNNYESIQNLSKNIDRLEQERYNILNIIIALNTIVNYYEKCERDNVLEGYDEICMYKEKESCVVDLEEITNILKEINCFEMEG